MDRTLLAPLKEHLLLLAEYHGAEDNARKYALLVREKEKNREYISVLTPFMSTMLYVAPNERGTQSTVTDTDFQNIQNLPETLRQLPSDVQLRLVHNGYQRIDDYPNHHDQQAWLTLRHNCKMTNVQCNRVIHALYDADRFDGNFYPPCCVSRKKLTFTDSLATFLWLTDIDTAEFMTDEVTEAVAHYERVAEAIKDHRLVNNIVVNMEHDFASTWNPNGSGVVLSLPWWSLPVAAARRNWLSP